MTDPEDLKIVEELEIKLGIKFPLIRVSAKRIISNKNPSSPFQGG